MKLETPTRRAFLRGAGLTLALPLLPSLFARTAQAASAASLPKPLRLFALKSYSTQHLVDWYPRFSGRSYQARPFDPNNGKADGTTELRQVIEQTSGKHRDGRAYFARHAPLADLAKGGSISKILGPELNPYLDQLLLLRGLDFMPAINHNDGGMLGHYASSAPRPTGIEDWPTIDQTLAFSPRFYRHTPLGPRSLHLSLSNPNTCSFTDNGVRGGGVVQVQAHTSPLSAFQEVFGALSPEQGEQRRKLIDRVVEDYRAARRDARLSALDREALEHHVALLSQLEDRIEVRPEHACSAPSEPHSGDLRSFDVDAIANTTRDMIDIALAAFRCDLTRVVTFDIWKAIGRGVGPGGSDLGYAHSAAKGPRDWHEQAHEFGRPEADRQILAINRWIASEVFARVVAGLNRVEEGGETYLHRSVVYWGNEMGMNHLNYSVPALLAGSAGGRLNTGAYVDYIDWQQPLKFSQENAPVIEGVPHNRLLVALLTAFGLQPSDYERNGQPGYGSYKTAGKTASEYPIDYDAARYGDPLPGLLKGTSS